MKELIFDHGVMMVHFQSDINSCLYIVCFFLVSIYLIFQGDFQGIHNGSYLNHTMAEAAE